MGKKYIRLTAFSALVLSCTAAQAFPFSSFDPRSMAMGGTGVAVDDPSTAPFFNPAMLSASDHSKKFSMEFVTLGASLIDPGNLHTNWSTINDSATALTNAGSALTTNSATLSGNITTLTNDINTNIPTITASINAISSLGTITLANAAAASTTLTNSLTSLSGSTTTLKTDTAGVSTSAATVTTNTNTASSNLNTINQLLLNLNNQPIQAELGAASVIAIPGVNWGFAVYANAWAAMGGTLEYKDAATVTTITTALNTTSTNLGNISSATGNASTDLNSANTSLTAAATACTAAAITAAGSAATCQANLTNAQAALTKAQGTMNTAATNVPTYANNISTAANSVNSNSTMQSVVHLRGVAVTEYGASISHGLVTNDVAWSWGITPKVMQMRLYDTTLGAKSSLNNASSSDYLAYYSTLNFDAGIAKTYLNGWRTGLVVKNVIPQSFDFKNAPTPGATPVSDGATLDIKPEVRAGVSYEQPNWYTLAVDADLTRNNPAGLESQSQYISVGGEFSTSGWTEIRVGYRADLVDRTLDVASVGIGFSPRVPYFKPHFDLAVTASPDIFKSGYNAATQAGVYLQFGLNF